MFRDEDPRQDSAARPIERSERRPKVVDDLTRSLDLPRGKHRELVGNHRLRGSEVRILAAVGAFRVVPHRDLAEQSSARSREIDRLRQAGLLSTTPYKVGRQRMTIVTLTRDGLEVLERHQRESGPAERQQFHAGISRPRELAHDSRLFAAYCETRDRIERDGGQVRRVVLEQELKSEYQRFLQEPNRGRPRSSGAVRRDANAIARWAAERDLPVVRGSVRFPDVRVEYDRPDGSPAREDLEVVTENYRGAHAAATSAAGFNCYRYRSSRLGGSGSSKGGRSRDERLAEEMLR